MTTDTIAATLSEAIGAEVSVREASGGLWRVDTPFQFADGDHLVIRLRAGERETVEWTDLGHTLMHLSYWMGSDVREGKRGELFEDTLLRFDVDDRDGELVLASAGDNLGPSLLSFAQALIHVADLDYLSRERVLSTFLEDFKAVLSDEFGDRAQFDYTDPERDREGLYPVSCWVNGANSAPLAVLAIPNDDAAKDATITLQQLRSWDRHFFSVGIFHDQPEINRKVLARFSNAVDKQYSSLYGIEDTIVDYLRAHSEP